MKKISTPLVNNSLCEGDLALRPLLLRAALMHAYQLQPIALAAGDSISRLLLLNFATLVCFGLFCNPLTAMKFLNRSHKSTSDTTLNLGLAKSHFFAIACFYV
jgi:hypothetical protein